MPTPDRSFMKDLKSIDRRLGVKFNGNNFVVTFERAHGEPANIHLVRNSNGGFRQPDRRDLEFIKGGDLESDSMKNRLQKLAYTSEKIREEQRRKAKSEIRDMTKDGKLQLAKAITQRTNAGKGNSAFRRVIPKPKRTATTEIHI